MKVALLQPDLSERYHEQRQAYGAGSRPPETGLAVLDSWARRYGRGHKIIILDPRKTPEELSQEASNYDLLGMSDWFSNHGSVVQIAKRIKELNPDTRVITGGTNASLVARETLTNHPYVDFIVARDGEDSFLGLVERKSIEEIPNLWYRNESQELRFTYQKFTALSEMPVWDFSNFQNADERLANYLQAQKEGLDPWLVPPVSLFSFRGCAKAMKEGVCRYCTSSETRGRALPAEKFWDQIKHLNQKHEAEIFYMADDIFTVSPKRIKGIANAKPQDVKARIRAYGYLPDLARLSQSKLEEMAEDLNRIGVFNLFYGSETYDSEVIRRSNKQPISIKETKRVIRTLKESGGIQATIAYMLGLPSENSDSLSTNEFSFKELLQADDCIERLYIGVAMPLKGTLWCSELQRDTKVTEEYKKETGKDLNLDDDPDYKTLSRLALKHQTSVSPQEVKKSMNIMIQTALDKGILDHKVGGFMWEI